MQNESETQYTVTMVHAVLQSTIVSVCNIIDDSLSRDAWLGPFDKFLWSGALLYQQM